MLACRFLQRSISNEDDPRFSVDILPMSGSGLLDDALQSGLAHLLRVLLYELRWIILTESTHLTSV